jgi:hypothetical protein
MLTVPSAAKASKSACEIESDCVAVKSLSKLGPQSKATGGVSLRALAVHPPGIETEAVEIRFWIGSEWRGTLAGDDEELGPGSSSTIPYADITSGRDG